MIGAIRVAGKEDLGCVLREPYPEITLIFPPSVSLLFFMVRRICTAR